MDKRTLSDQSNINEFCGYTVLLHQIKYRVQLAQQRSIYAANEEMLRMYWDIGELLQKSQDIDGWGKKTLERLSIDLKNAYPVIKGLPCGICNIWFNSIMRIIKS